MMADAKIKLVLRGGTLRVRMRGSDGDLSDMLANALADLLAKCYLKGKLDDEGFEAGLERMRTTYERAVCKMREAMRHDAG